MAEDDGICGETGNDLEVWMRLTWGCWGRREMGGVAAAPVLRVPWEEVDMRRVSPFVLCSEPVFLTYRWQRTVIS
jgi:hypothetical protein